MPQKVLEYYMERNKKPHRAGSVITKHRHRMQQSTPRVTIQQDDQHKGRNVVSITSTRRGGADRFYKQKEKGATEKCFSILMCVKRGDVSNSIMETGLRT